MNDHYPPLAGEVLQSISFFKMGWTTELQFNPPPFDYLLKLDIRLPPAGDINILSFENIDE